jgi:hypothetical protein
MQRNDTGKLRVMARWPSGAPYLSGAATISATINGVAADDAVPTEIGNGVYEFDLTAAETNVADVLPVVVCSVAGVGLTYKTQIGTLPAVAQIGGTGPYYVEVLDANGAAVAPASTALSSVTWTGTKAGYLDGSIAGIPAATLTALGTGTWASEIPWNAAWDAEVQSKCADALTAWGKTGFSLAADGLDSITATEPTGKPTTFRGWVMWLVQCFRAGTMTATTKLVKTEAGATVTTQTVSDDGTTETLGPPT